MVDWQEAAYPYHTSKHITNDLRITVPDNDADGNITLNNLRRIPFSYHPGDSSHQIVPQPRLDELQESRAQLYGPFAHDIRSTQHHEADRQLHDCPVAEGEGELHGEVQGEGDTMAVEYAYIDHDSQSYSFLHDEEFWRQFDTDQGVTTNECNAMAKTQPHVEPDGQDYNFSFEELCRQWDAAQGVAPNDSAGYSQQGMSVSADQQLGSSPFDAHMSCTDWDVPSTLHEQGVEHSHQHSSVGSADPRTSDCQQYVATHSHQHAPDYPQQHSSTIPGPHETDYSQQYLSTTQHQRDTNNLHQFIDCLEQYSPTTQYQQDTNEPCQHTTAEHHQQYPSCPLHALTPPNDCTIMTAETPPWLGTNDNTQTVPDQYEQQGHLVGQEIPPAIWELVSAIKARVPKGSSKNPQRQHLKDLTDPILHQHFNCTGILRENSFLKNYYGDLRLFTTACWQFLVARKPRTANKH